MKDVRVIFTGMWIPSAFNTFSSAHQGGIF